MNRLIVCWVFVFCGWALAHVPDEAGRADSDWESVSRVLEASFVAIEANSGLVGDRPFRFVDDSGRAYFLGRLRLTEALISALSVLERDPRCVGGDSRPHHCHHHPNWRERLVSRVNALTTGVGRITGASAEVARHYGLVPLVVVLVTWLPYTAATEILESFVVGPAHLWCTLSQMLYFGAIEKMALSGRILSEAVRHRGSSLSLWQRVKALCADSLALSRYRKLLKRVLVDLVGAVVNRADFWKFSVAGTDRNAVTQLYGLSGIWADYYAASQRLTKSWTDSGLADLDKVMENRDGLKKMRLLEIVSGLELLSSLVRKRIVLSYTTGRSGWGAYTANMFRLGEWMGRMERWHRAVLLHGNTNPDPAQVELLHEGYQTLIQDLRGLSGISTACSDRLSEVRPLPNDAVNANDSYGSGSGG